MDPRMSQYTSKGGNRTHSFIWTLSVASTW